jgi:hypothetical protein
MTRRPFGASSPVTGDGGGTSKDDGLRFRGCQSPLYYRSSHVETGRPGARPLQANQIEELLHNGGRRT